MTKMNSMTVSRTVQVSGVEILLLMIVESVVVTLPLMTTLMSPI